MAEVRGDALQEEVAAAVAAYEASVLEADAALKIALLKPETVAPGMVAFNDAFRLAAIKLQTDMARAQAHFASKVEEEMANLKRVVSGEPPPYQG